MNRGMIILTTGILFLLLTGCTQAQVTPDAEVVDETEAPATATIPQATIETNPYPLGEPGPYHVGKLRIQTEDPDREDRPVGITVWYPAIKTGESKPGIPTLNADPDAGGAPYPLILSSTKMAEDLAPILVSHGFTWASVDKIDSYYLMNQQMIDQPLDILFAMDLVASHPPESLEGMIDAGHAGSIGYSFDGYNSLALSGARIDPQYYLAQCPTADATTEAITKSLSAFDCTPAENWEEYATHAGEAITTSTDGLWQPMTDPRIRAVMPMAGEGWWLFGEKGLAAVDWPVLIIVASEDALFAENTLIFEFLGVADKTLIQFNGEDHMMIFDPKSKARIAHFAVAFFGYHLQGRQDLAYYFSQEFILQHEDLTWGAKPDD